MQLLSDEKIKWVPYCREEKICELFPLDVWHRIVHDIDSDIEWADFLEKSLIVKCYILKLCSNDQSIAFLYIMQENLAGTIVSVHGGVWGSPLLHFRGYILMLKHLLEQGLKVRTYCNISNTAAIRFDRSVGFVPYRYTEDEVFMWISEKRLKNNKLYKRFYPNELFVCQGDANSKSV